MSRLASCFVKTPCLVQNQTLSIRTIRYKWMYGFHGFHRLVRIFLEFLLETQAKNKKNPYESVKSVKSVHPFVSQFVTYFSPLKKHPQKFHLIPSPTPRTINLWHFDIYTFWKFCISNEIPKNHNARKKP
ncbi:MAG: hypothetical protein RLZZ628_1264 [Bacteroidota bacterium]